MLRSVLLIFLVVLEAGTHDLHQSTGRAQTNTEYVSVSAQPEGGYKIQVQWTVDASVSDSVTSYDLSWSTGGEGQGDGSVSIEDGSTNSYTITGLSPCTTYTITLQPNNDMGTLGEPGQTWAETSTQAVTPVSSVVVTEVLDNSQQLYVSWELAMDIGNCPGYYKVTWGVPQALGEAVVRDTTSYTIIDLDPWTHYFVCVDSGQDENSLFNRAECGDTTTSEDVPGGPPQAMSVTGSTNDTITLQWDLPEKPNGIIVSYTVTWSPDDGTYKTPDGETFTYTIPNLLVCTDYDISVTATTSKGSGPPGHTSGSTQAVVSSSPSSLVISSVTNKSDQLEVTWTQPEDTNNCVITSNTVSWWLNSTGDEVGNETLEPAESYSITGLDSWTTYRVCVTANNQGGQSPEACDAQATDEDKPGGPPQKLKVTNVATDSMGLEWQPPADPNGNIINYEVNWSPEDNTGREVVTGEAYNMSKLLACTTYTITVTAATNKGSGPPADTSSSTHVTAPGPPTNVAVATDKADSLKVTWTQAEVGGRCNITSNIITWRLSNTETLIGNDTVEPTESYTIIGLDTFTFYLVCVSATTQELDGPQGPCINQTTDEEVPAGPPLNVHVLGATKPNSITLEWEPPTQPNGVITNYLVAWISNIDPSDRGNATAKEQRCTITGLLACSNYTVSVSAGNSKGYGPSAETFGETQPGAPGPPTDVMVKMVVNQSDHLTVSWTQAKPAGKCGITSNTVTWQLKGGDNLLGNKTMNPTESFTITDLEPWTDYTVCVSASYLHLSGPEGKCDDQTTDEDLPGPPVNIATHVLSSESILVMWDPPKKPNGVITEYHIKWSSESGNSGEGVAESNTTSYSASDLTECTDYSFSVTAATSKGLGGKSESADNTTDAEAPPVPVGVSCTNVQARQIKVTWDEPDTACEVTQYLVSYNGQVLWDNSINEGGTDNTNETSIILEDLLPWTNYSVCVKAEVEDSIEGGNGCCIATTKEEVPEGPPQNVTVASRTSDSITLQWDPPAAPNGVITNYSVSWSPDDDQTTTNITTDTKLTLTGLLPCTTYTITITAATSQGYGPPADTSTNTKPKVPLSVTNLNLTQLIHEFSLKTTWAPVTPPGNCKISYKVAWGFNGSEMGHNTTTESHFTITDLVPGKAYNVCVTAVAEGEKADPVCESETTVTTRLDLHLQATSTTITASWFAIDDADKFVVAWSYGNVGDFKVVNGDSFTIEEANPCTNYSVILQAMAVDQKLDFDEDFIRTLPQATSSITNLNVSQVSDNPTLEVTWSPVTPPGNCDLAYKVTWSYLNHTEVGNDTTTDPHYTITNLAYNAKYEVCVASSVEGEMASPVCKQVTLTEERLALTLVPTSTTISVSWALIKNADAYLVMWADGSAGGFEETNATTDKYDITGLDPCTNESVKVQAKATDTVLKEESAFTRTLPEAASPASDITVSQMKHEPGLGVTWSPVAPSGNCGLYYKLSWSYSNSTEVGHDTTIDLHYNVTGLAYDTVYNVCVVSSVEGEDASPVCDLGTTIDSRLGMYLEAMSTTIMVYWNLIEGADTYRIMWFNGEDGAWTSVGGEIDNYIINDLDSCSNYSIDLQALAGGQQVEDDKDSIMTSPTVPSEVTDLSITQGKETTLDVTWSPVMPPGNCELVYKVMWSYANSSEAGHDTSTAPHYTITDLTYDTEYTVCVASSVQGLDADQVCGKGTVVSPSMAGAVENLRVSSGIGGWIRVDWVRPARLVCDVQGYRLTWNTHTLPQLLSQDATHYTITRLQPHTTYTITIQARCGGAWGATRTVAAKTAGKRGRKGSPDHIGKVNSRMPPLALTHAGLLL